MPLQRFMIAPYREGMDRAVKPWLISNEAFETLENAYLFRGRVRKRVGADNLNNVVSSLQSRLRISAGTTDGAGFLSGTFTSTLTMAVGQQFSIGADTYTITALGSPATIVTAGGATISVNTTTNAYTITGVPAKTEIFFYPSLPVLGLKQYNDESSGQRELFAFDQTYSYKYNRTAQAFERFGSGNNSRWQGSTSNYFWITRWTNVDPDEYWTFACNDQPFDNGTFDATVPNGIKYAADGDTSMTNFAPIVRTVGGNLRMSGARILLPYKGRLLAFAPYESTETGGSLSAPIQVNNRVRFSWPFSLTDSDNAFLERFGNGGYIDLPTAENIVTVGLVKDRIIVYTERSTYMLLYNGNAAQPYSWQRINSTIGAESLQGTVDFDEASFTIGNNGIYACNGAAMDRVDRQIPDEVFKIKNILGPTHKVSGIRDYFTEMIYWAFPDATRISGTVDQDFPNRILVYDYANNAWAFFDDVITTWDYFERVDGFTWNSWHTPWESSTWPWNSGTNIQRFTKVIGGNHQGYIIQMEPKYATNSTAMTLTNMTAPNQLTIVNHNLQVNDYIRIRNATGITSLNVLNVKVTNVVDKDTVDIDTTFSGTYTGDGVIERLSRINILTKEFNFFLNEGRNTFIPYLELYVTRTTDGAIGLQYFTDSSIVDLAEDASESGAALHDGEFITVETAPYAISPYERGMDRLWHRAYTQAEGNVIQFRMYAPDDLMENGDAVDSWFQLHAMLIYAEPLGTRLGF